MVLIVELMVIKCDETLQPQEIELFPTLIVATVCLQIRLDAELLADAAKGPSGVLRDPPATGQAAGRVVL